MNVQTAAKSLDEWLHWLENTRPETAIDLGLDRVRLVGEELGLLKPAPFVITVAGTNGKGSTIALLEAILLAAGYKVGVFTSPHFIRFNERVRINGQQVDDGPLREAFEKINSGRGGTWLTYFEFATLAAVHCFQRAEVDIALMEVGLGGRLDATNAVEPDVSVVTTVALDHQDWLGYSIEAIAREKAGIFRTDKPGIYGDSAVPASVVDQVIRREVPLFRRDHEFAITRTENSWSWSGLSAAGEKIKLEELPLPEVVLDNAASAIQALQFLPEAVTRDAICEGLVSAKLTGRYQRLQQDNPAGESVSVILDVAHNPQAARKFCERLEAEPVEGKTRMVIAMYGDKDYGSVIEELASSIDEWFVTEFDSPRALAAEKLCEALRVRELQCQQYPGVKQAFDAALAASGSQDRVLVCGSFITVAEALTDLRQL